MRPNPSAQRTAQTARAPEPACAPLHFAPCLPAGWSGFSLDYRWGQSVYAITVQPLADALETRVLLDGLLLANAVLPLVDDGVAHRVVVQFQPSRQASLAP